MSAFRFADRRIHLAGLLTMLTLLAMSMVFWRERTWLLDVAFQTFLMVKDQTVQVMVYRFGAATVQSLPLLGIQLGAPLAWVSWLYSVSFHLHFLGFFCLCAYGFKRQDVALGIALLYTAMTYDGFYWQTSELQQGLGFLLVSWAALLRFPQPQKAWHWLAWAITVVALAFYHPLVFMPFYLMLIWLWFKPSAGVPRLTLGTLAAMMLVVLVIKQIWFQNWYDAQKTAQFAAHFNADFPHFFTYPAYGRFLLNAVQVWWGYLILLLGSSAWLGYRQRWFGLGILWLASCGFLVLTAIGDPETPHRFYAEVNYYPLLAFVLVPVILNLGFLKQDEETSWKAMPTKKSQVIGYALPAIVFFLLARLLLIGFHATEYTHRVDYLRALTAQADRPKTVVDPSSLNQEILLMDWGLPYETLLQSATETTVPVTILSLTESQRRDKAEVLQSDTLFVTPWTTFPLQQVNDNVYWELPKTTY